ncbi:hypothetical protein K439DRAFT_1620459 [Ramaria rubella]|nr:hypothetical protein K439DRAFT_1620459 [Ramaria rubella]
MEGTYRKIPAEKLGVVCKWARKKWPWLGEFERTWPVHDMIKTYLQQMLKKKKNSTDTDDEGPSGDEDEEPGADFDPRAVLDRREGDGSTLDGNDHAQKGLNETQSKREFGDKQAGKKDAPPQEATKRGRPKKKKKQESNRNLSPAGVPTQRGEDQPQEDAHQSSDRPGGENQQDAFAHAQASGRSVSPGGGRDDDDVYGFGLNSLSENPDDIFIDNQGFFYNHEGKFIEVSYQGSEGKYKTTIDGFWVELDALPESFASYDKGFDDGI